MPFGSGFLGSLLPLIVGGVGDDAVGVESGVLVLVLLKDLCRRKSCVFIKARFHFLIACLLPFLFYFKQFDPYEGGSFVGNTILALCCQLIACYMSHGQSHVLKVFHTRYIRLHLSSSQGGESDRKL